MDKKIEPKKGMALLLSKKALPYWSALLVVAFVLYLILRDNVSTLRIDNEALSISEVVSGDFNDYIRVNGQVQRESRYADSQFRSRFGGERKFAPKHNDFHGTATS